MSTGFFTLLYAIIPFIFYIFVFFKKRKAYCIENTSVVSSFFLLLLMAILMGVSPIEPDTDKDRYLEEYLGLLKERDSDFGWGVYSDIMQSILGSNVILFFVVTAIIYSFSYFYFSKKLFPENGGYLLILITGSLGFSGYGSNAIRSGMALALLIQSLVVPKNKWNKIIVLLILLISLSLHKSMIIPIAAYVAANYLKNLRFVESFWMFCLFISVLDINIVSLFEQFAFVDDRVMNYVDSKGGYDSDYSKMGFRPDFVVYSLLPVYIANIWMKRYNYYSDFYGRLYRAYLFANSIWLLSMRVNFADRIAYLSWFMMPMLLLYPLLSGELKIKNAQGATLLIIGTFVGMNLLLSLR